MGRYEKRSIIETTLECPVCKKRTVQSRGWCCSGREGYGGVYIRYGESYYKCKECGCEILKSEGKCHKLLEEIIGEETIDNGEAWYLDCERD